MTIIDVYCVSCGEDGRADAQTGKCMRCGHLAMAAATISDSLDRSANRTVATNGHALPARYILPSSRPTRKWIETTRALEAGLLAAAADAEKKAADILARVDAQVAGFKAEAVRQRNAATVLTQLLRQVGVSDEPPALAKTKRSVAARAEGRPWARTRDGEVFEACSKCGSTDRKHKSKGLCERCYR